MKSKEKIEWEYDREPENYNEWLKATGEKDTKLNREWYDTPVEDSAKFIKNHQGWWNK